ncbi:hypothetical protein Sm713_79560 [Streptomyces sp. TS71-3]|nr:hypothetical protein Sm713_79560 [Streptomyces sp. TS71-3]
MRSLSSTAPLARCTGLRSGDRGKAGGPPPIPESQQCSYRRNDRRTATAPPCRDGGAAGCWNAALVGGGAGPSARVAGGPVPPGAVTGGCYGLRSGAGWLP